MFTGERIAGDRSEFAVAVGIFFLRGKPLASVKPNRPGLIGQWLTLPVDRDHIGLELCANCADVILRRDAHIERPLMHSGFGAGRNALVVGVGHTHFQAKHGASTTLADIGRQTNRQFAVAIGLAGACCDRLVVTRAIIGAEVVVVIAKRITARAGIPINDKVARG